jgi:hypothetical protein
VDFLLGNSDPGDPNYDLNRRYGLVVMLAITSGGTYHGSPLADDVSWIVQVAGAVHGP